MKAPDKIYIPIVREEKSELLCTIWWPEDNRTERDKEFIPEVIPYIRKDALLEWANRILDCNITSAMRIAVRGLISKINSL